MGRGIPIRPMRIFEYLGSSGEADHGALGVAEVCDDETIGDVAGSPLRTPRRSASDVTLSYLKAR